MCIVIHLAKMRDTERYVRSYSIQQPCARWRSISISIYFLFCVYVHFIIIHWMNELMVEWICNWLAQCTRLADAIEEARERVNMWLCSTWKCDTAQRSHRAIILCFKNSMKVLTECGNGCIHGQPDDRVFQRQTNNSFFAIHIEWLN